MKKLFSIVVLSTSLMVAYAAPRLAVSKLPALPTNFAVSLTASTPTNFLPTLSWKDASNNEDGFIVERNTGSGYVAIATLPANAQSFADTSAENALLMSANGMNTTFYYRLSVFNQSGSNTSTTLVKNVKPSSLTVTSSPLAVAANLTASTPTSFVPTITWSDASSNEDGFIIERKIDGGMYEYITTTSPNATSYQDITAENKLLSGATMSSIFMYRVTSFNRYGSKVGGEASSSPSSLAVKTLPTNFMVSASSSTPTNFLPVLSWTDTTNNEDGFIIERKIDGGMYEYLTTTSPNTTSYHDITAENKLLSGATMNSVFTYRIAVFNRYGSLASTVYVSTSPATLVVSSAPLAVAANLTASTPTNFLPTVTWSDASSNEDGFIIERKIDGGMYEYITTTSPNATSYQDITAENKLLSGATMSSIFMYRVTSFNRYGSKVGGEASVSPSTLGQLVLPSSFTVSASSSTPTNFLPVLSWGDRSNNEDGFLLERKIDAGAFEYLTTTSPNATSYHDITAENKLLSGATMNSVFTYRIAVFNRYGLVKSTVYAKVSPSSLAVSSAPLAIAINLSSSTPEFFAPQITWTDASFNEDGFMVERKIDGGMYEYLTSTPANGTSYFDMDAQNKIFSGVANQNSVFTYRVTSFNRYGSKVGVEVSVSPASLVASSSPVVSLYKTTASLISRASATVVGGGAQIAKAFLGVKSASAATSRCVSLGDNFHRGNESTLTKELQQFLIQKGFLKEAVSGFYGDKTVDAVKAYQRSAGLKETGMVYDLTRKAIEADTCQP